MTGRDRSHADAHVSRASEGWVSAAGLYPLTSVPPVCTARPPPRPPATSCQDREGTVWGTGLPVMLSGTPPHTRCRGSQGLTGSGTSATCPSPSLTHTEPCVARPVCPGLWSSQTQTATGEGTMSPQRPPEAWRQGRPREHRPSPQAVACMHPERHRRPARRAGAWHRQRPVAQRSGSSAGRFSWAPVSCPAACPMLQPL